MSVALADALIKQGWIQPREKYYEVTARGKLGFEKFGIDINGLRSPEIAPDCLDWTEKRFHLSGSLGAALAQQFLERTWLIKDKHSRIVHLRNEGQKGFAKVFGVKI
ncbi:MAG: hypothetical protein ACRCYY_11770 [Trueperaceae bacterium]